MKWKSNQFAIYGFILYFSFSILGFGACAYDSSTWKRMLIMFLSDLEKIYVVKVLR